MIKINLINKSNELAMDSPVKKSLKRILLINLVILILFSSQINSDRPCAARPIADRSVVCVCNNTYCDDVTRHPPTRGQYVTYTSSKAGSRLKQFLGILQSNDATHDCCSLSLQLDPRTQYQTIEGFGGAVTDSAGINWRSLSDDLQKHLINSYFGDKGLQYSVIRIPIGGCDFSTRPYAYNELPEDDVLLTNYTLAYEDYQYKIPMIKAILNTSSTPVHIVATTWSPPAWMKTNDKYKGASRLKPIYFQTYADYHYKFIEKYAAEGIKIWGITTTNEPTNGVIPLAKFNSLGWTSNNMGRWIINNLGPTIRNSTFKDLKIITVDDQRFTLPYWFNVMLKYHPRVVDWIDGVAVHYYADIITPPSFLSLVSETHPDKFILATEACEGSFPWQEKVDIGSWSRARNYIVDIIVDLNHNVVGWLDWNMCLDQNGGPNWAENFVDSPILVFPELGEFIKQPMFYAMGHFSKFIPRGSRRIKVVEQMSLLSNTVEYTAFITPNNTIVVVLYNENNEGVSVRIKQGNKNAVVEMEALSVVTVEFNYTP